MMKCPDCGTEFENAESCPTCGCPTSMCQNKNDEESSQQNQASVEIEPTEEEIKKFNLGAFTFTWIWALVHEMWIHVIVIILASIFTPFFSLAACIVMGIKGNEWAWKYKKWNSVEDFRTTQRKWAKWAKIAWCVIGVIIVLYIIFFVGILGWNYYWIGKLLAL